MNETPILTKRQYLDYRQRIQAGDFVVVAGEHRAQELVASGRRYDIWLSDVAIEGATQATSEQLKGISQLATAPRMVLLLPIPQTVPEAPKRALYLDEVQDPGNVGTCIRTAAWFGCDAVYLSPGCANPFSAKSVQASGNAIFQVPIVRNAELPHLWVVGTDMGSPWQATTPTEAWCLVVGNEGHGMSQAVRAATSQIIGIPAYAPERAPESLNVAQAATAILAAWTLQ
jgi:TrmH family RNA methyltransferase